MCSPPYLLKLDQPFAQLLWCQVEAIFLMRYIMVLAEDTYNAQFSRVRVLLTASESADQLLHLKLHPLKKTLPLPLRPDMHGSSAKWGAMVLTTTSLPMRHVPLFSKRLTEHERGQRLHSRRCA